MQGLLAFKRYYDFSGRSSRAEYWQYMAIMVAAVLLSAALGGANEAVPLPMLTILVLLGTTIPTYAVTVRRLHDRGITGWAVGVVWILNGASYTLQDMLVSSGGNVLVALLAKVVLAATVGYALFLLYPLVMPGDEKANAYGPPPAAADSDLARHVQAHPTEGPLQGDDRLSKIERLAKLRQDGVLTEAEFEQQKAALLK